MTTQTLASASNAKNNTRTRCGVHPTITFGDSIELTSKIYKKFGDSTFTSLAKLSKKLNIRKNKLQSQVSSCVEFGLLKKKLGGGYRPCDLFNKLYGILPEQIVHDVFISLFLRPLLHKSIVEQFNGRVLPQEAELASILFRKQMLPKNGATLLAKIFIDSAIECGFLKKNGILKV